MQADEFTRAPHIRFRHANVVRCEVGIERNLAFAAGFDDVDMRPVTTLVARVDDDPKTLEFKPRHEDNNLHGVGLSIVEKCFRVTRPSTDHSGARFPAGSERVTYAL